MRKTISCSDFSQNSSFSVFLTITHSCIVNIWAILFSSWLFFHSCKQASCELRPSRTLWQGFYKLCTNVQSNSSFNWLEFGGHRSMDRVIAASCLLLVNDDVSKMSWGVFLQTSSWTDEQRLLVSWFLLTNQLILLWFFPPRTIMHNFSENCLKSLNFEENPNLVLNSEIKV